MTEDALLVLQSLGGMIWRFFTSWHIPGTNVTPGMIGIFYLIADISLNFMHRMFDSPPSSGSVARSTKIITKHRGD